MRSRRAARLLLAQGHRERASALLVELEQVAGIRADPYYAAALPGARAHRARPSAAGARRHGSWTVLSRRTPLSEHALSASRAQLTEAAGEHAEAAQLYAEAAERWREFGNVPERAYALLGQGRSLAALGKPEAEEPLRAARELFASMGFTPAVAEVDGLLGSPEAAAL